MYPVYAVDVDGQKLNGASRYTLHFALDQLPPVHAFWSLTMYDLPASLLVANPINRYLINSPLLPQLKKDDDGGRTLRSQTEPPGRIRKPAGCPRRRAVRQVQAALLAARRGSRRQVDCTAA